MEKLKIRTMYNCSCHEGQVFDKPSLTVPDKTLTIEEMLVRHSKGLPMRKGVRTIELQDNHYNGNTEIVLPVFHADLTVLDELKNQVSHTAEIATKADKELTAHKKAKAEKAAADALSYQTPPKTE